MKDSEGFMNQVLGVGGWIPWTLLHYSRRRAPTPWLPTHGTQQAEVAAYSPSSDGRSRMWCEDPAVLLLRGGQGAGAGGVGATLPCSPPCQGDRHSGRSKVEYPKESR